MKIIKGDICDIKADAIINASNGMGFMGGFLSRYIKFRGIAENINYKTKGIIEKEAKKKCKLKRYLPIILGCKKAGEVFHTSAGSLNAKYIIHAITMKYPGTKSSLKTINELIPKIINEAYVLGCKSIAIPLLGTGVGGLKKEDVLNIYEGYFKEIKDIEIIIITY